MFAYLDKKQQEFRSRGEVSEVQERYQRVLTTEWPENDCRLDKVPSDAWEVAVGNHRKALALISLLAANNSLSIDLAKRVHATLMSGLSDEAGLFRSNEVTPLTESHEPPGSRAVPFAVAQLVDWAGTESFSELHPVQQSALILIRLLDIYPFAAGTPRTSRVLANLYFLRAGFPPAIVFSDKAKDYHEAVAAGFRMDTTPLTTLIAGSVDRVLDFCLYGSSPR